MPFDTEDAMFNPPLMRGRASTYDYDITDATAPIVPDTPPVSRPPPHQRKTSDNVTPGENPKQHHIIFPEEDMRRLFQECKIGTGNANLLSQALAMATPEQLNDSVIVEFHKKCIDSQELIYIQIPWATAGAERAKERARTDSTANGNGTPVPTREEELLTELLTSNEQLIDALIQYDDLEREAEGR